MLRYRQFADDQDNQAKEHAQQQQEGERSIHRLNAQHHIVIEDHNRQHAEQDGEYEQQPDGQGQPAHALTVSEFAYHIQRANIGCLDDGHQTKDQRGRETDSHTTGDSPGIQYERDVQAGILHQDTYNVAQTRRRRRSDNTAYQSEQASFEAKQRVEVHAPVARRLQHGNLCLTTRQ